MGHRPERHHQPGLLWYGSDDRLRAARAGEGPPRPGWSGRARYVPERRSHRGQSRSLTVSVSADPQVSQSAGDGATAPQTSQADSPTSEPNPDRAGHSWDATQPPIEPTSITAGHRSKTDLSRGGLKTVGFAYPGSTPGPATTSRRSPSSTQMWRGLLPLCMRPAGIGRLRLAWVNTRRSFTGPVQTAVKEGVHPLAVDRVPSVDALGVTRISTSTALPDCLGPVHPTFSPVDGCPRHS